MEIEICLGDKYNFTNCDWSNHLLSDIARGHFCKADRRFCWGEFLYYGFENESMPFSSVMMEWENIASESKVKLICGLAPYKSGKVDEFAGKGENEWEENVNILSRQYEQTLKSQVWQGFSLFSYSYCFGENVTQNSKKEIKNLLYMVE